jgi:hypothetical protein
MVTHKLAKALEALMANYKFKGLAAIVYHLSWALATNIKKGDYGKHTHTHELF